MQNVLVLKSILRCFKLASGLKINFNDISCRGVSVDFHIIKQFIVVLNCTSLKIPFIYLGISIGGNPRQKRLWDAIIAKIRIKWSYWDQSPLSFGRMIRLIRSEFSTLP